jgi:putative tricarboxylic transport membrane protein
MLIESLENVFLDPQLLGIVLLAATYGIVVGAIPGFSATMAVALIIPMTFFLRPLHALSAVVTLEACAIFSGDIPAALIRMPGTPASAAYTDDLYQLGRRGRARGALGVSLLSSVVGGLFGVMVLVLLTRPAAGLAASVTVIEYFWFYCLGLSCAVAVSRGSALRGALGLLIGLLLATIGLSAAHNQARFTFGIAELYDGIGFIPAMIGLFGLSEVLRGAARGVGEEMARTGSSSAEMPPGSRAALPADGDPEQRLDGPQASVFGAAWDLLRFRKLRFLLAAMIGTVIGILPGAGADIAAWVSFGVSKRLSRRPEEYGRGSLEGVFDASAANNAALAGAWVPALIFGIPGDSITALVIGIMMMKNLRPGPDIFEKQAVLIHSLYLVFILANLVLIPLGFLAIKAGSHLVRVPRRVLLPVILLFCVLGSYSINGSAFDVWVMLAMGLLGFVLERRQVPLGPVVLGIVLGGSVEETFIQSLTATGGSLLGFISRPASMALSAACAGLWLWPLAGSIAGKMRRTAAGARFILGPLAIASLFAGVAAAAEPPAAPPTFASGPLRVSQRNPRYFEDAEGRIVYLTGAYVFDSLSEKSPRDPPPPFDFPAFLAHLQRHNHNFFRMWTRDEQTLSPPATFGPLPYARTGPGTALDGKPRFDLTRYDPEYFTRLRERVSLAGRQGIYVSVMLFQTDGQRPWRMGSWKYHVFNAANNANGIDGDPAKEGRGHRVYTLEIPAITRLQEAYVRHVLDTTGDLDNVLYEIANEPARESRDWELHMLAVLRAHERTKPRRHPAGLTGGSGLDEGQTAFLLQSPADWIAPERKEGGVDYMTDPPASTGKKVVIADSDHIFGVGGDVPWVWKSFCRGLNPILLERYALSTDLSGTIDPRFDGARRNLGYARMYSRRIDLGRAAPNGELASTKYCLSDGKTQFLVFAPEGGPLSVDLAGAPGLLSVEWLDPETGEISPRGQIVGGAPQQLMCPFKGGGVVYVHAR